MRNEKNDGAGLIGQTIPDVAETEPRLNPRKVRARVRAGICGCLLTGGSKTCVELGYGEDSLCSQCLAKALIEPQGATQAILALNTAFRDRDMAAFIDARERLILAAQVGSATALTGEACSTQSDVAQRSSSESGDES